MSMGIMLALAVAAIIAFKVVKGVIGFIFKMAVLAAMVFAFIMWKQGGSF
jgi:hypothetical protein